MAQLTASPRFNHPAVLAAGSVSATGVATVGGEVSFSAAGKWSTAAKISSNLTVSTCSSFFSPSLPTRITLVLAPAPSFSEDQRRRVLRPQIYAFVLAHQVELGVQHHVAISEALAIGRLIQRLF